MLRGGPTVTSWCPSTRRAASAQSSEGPDGPSVSATEPAASATSRTATPARIGIGASSRGEPGVDAAPDGGSHILEDEANRAHRVPGPFGRRRRPVAEDEHRGEGEPGCEDRDEGPFLESGDVHVGQPPDRRPRRSAISAARRSGLVWSVLPNWPGDRTDAWAERRGHTKGIRLLFPRAVAVVVLVVAVDHGGRRPEASRGPRLRFRGRSWRVHHRTLKKLPDGGQEWVEFEGSSNDRPNHGRAGERRGRLFHTAAGPDAGSRFAR